MLSRIWDCADAAVWRGVLGYLGSDGELTWVEFDAVYAGIFSCVFSLYMVLSLVFLYSVSICIVIYACYLILHVARPYNALFFSFLSLN